MTSHQGISFLLSLPVWREREKFDLVTATALLSALGNPQDDVPSVHITGSNGKGSVASFLASIFHKAGETVGQYSSPHLSNIAERCLVNGRAISDEEYNSAVLVVKELAEKNNLSPTFFEYTTAVAFYEFSKRKLKRAVIEVGLGGRLDATNCIRRSLATVFTSVSLEHTNLLGSTLEAIAKEKMGIFRPGVPIFVGNVPPQIRKLLESSAKEIQSPVHFLAKEHEVRAQILLPELFSSYQISNAALAICTAQKLGIEESAISAGIQNARWPGRLEKFPPTPYNKSPCPVLIDGAHNIDGISALIDHLRAGRGGAPESQLIFIIGILGTKNWKGMLSHLSQAFSGATFIFTSPEHPESVSPKSLQTMIPEGLSANSPEKALELAYHTASTNSLIVITGSLYLIGELRPQLTDAPFCTIG